MQVCAKLKSLPLYVSGGPAVNEPCLDSMLNHVTLSPATLFLAIAACIHTVNGTLDVERAPLRCELNKASSNCCCI